MVELQEIIEGIENPSKNLREFLPIPFFFLNNDLPDDEIEWVMDNLAEQHFGGVFMHPRTGLEIEFLSDKFFERYEKFMEKCIEHNMDMWLYDEYNWPSGPVAGEFNRKYPEYLAKGIAYYQLSIKKGKKFEWKTDLMNEEFYYFTIIPKGSKGKLEESITIPPPKYQTPDHIKMINEFGVKFNDDMKSLAIAMPPCSGKIYIFYLALDIGFQFSVLCSPKVNPVRGYIDPLNRDAVKKFIEMSYEKFKEKLGKYFGKEIKGIFTDEPAFYAGMMYTPTLPDEFMTRYNYSFFNSFYLYFEKTERSPKFKTDYHTLVEEMLSLNFSSQIREWCDKNNLEFTGHLLMEENGFTNGVYLWGSAHKAMAPFSIPGIDYLGDVFSPNFKKQNSIMGLSAKLLHSVQVLNGAERTLCEAFGGSTWRTDISIYKNGVNFLTIQGINLINPHAVHFSIKGLRKRDFPNSYFVQQPYYPYFHHAADYTARASYLNTIGVHKTNTTILFPDIHQKIINPLLSSDKEAKHYGKGFYTILNFLHASQFDPDLIFESSIYNKTVKTSKDRIISAGKEDYSVIFVPPLKFIRIETLKFLKEVFNNGGTVLFIGTLPSGSENGWDDNQLRKYYQEIFNTSELELMKTSDILFKENSENGLIAYLPIKLPLTWQKILKKFKSIYHKKRPKHFKHIQIISGSEPHKVLVSKRKLNNLNTDLYFIANISTRSNDITFRILDYGTIYQWDLNTGKRTPFNRYKKDDNKKSFIVKHKFGTAEMIVLEVNHSNPITPRATSEVKARNIILNDKWEIIPQSDNSLVLKKWYYHPLPSDAWPKRNKVPVPTLGYYHVLKTAKGWFIGVLKLLNLLLDRKKENKVKKVKIGTYGAMFGDMDFGDANKYYLAAFKKPIIFMGSYGILLEAIRPLLHKGNLEHFLHDLNLFLGQEFVCFTHFTISEIPNQLYLVYEDIGEPVTLYLNNKKLLPGDKKFVWDKSNRVIDIRKFIVKGKNKLIIRTQKPKFSDWIPSTHAIDPVVLIGDFILKNNKIRKLTFPTTSPLKDWKKYGFPSYSGAISYIQKVKINNLDENQKVKLEMTDVKNMASVEVNNKDCGFITSPPWVIDISKAVREGENSIRINVLNTCENLLGKPRKSGLFGTVFIKYQ